MEENQMKLLTIKQFLEEIKPVIERASGIQGFVLTTRTDKSTIRIAWGDTKIYKNWNKKNGN